MVSAKHLFPSGSWCSLEVHCLVCREFADAVSSEPNFLLVTKMINQAYLLAAQPPP